MGDLESAAEWQDDTDLGTPNWFGFVVSESVCGDASFFTHFLPRAKAEELSDRMELSREAMELSREASELSRKVRERKTNIT